MPKASSRSFFIFDGFELDLEAVLFLSLSEFRESNGAGGRRFAWSRERAEEAGGHAGRRGVMIGATGAEKREEQGKERWPDKLTGLVEAGFVGAGDHNLVLFDTR